MIVRLTRLWFAAGAFLGFLAVALGAFGAHALSETLEPRYLEIFKTGVQYQFYHAFALFVVAWASQANWIHVRLIKTAGWAFLLGIVIFSGSLYVLALSGVKTWGAVTPFGGVLFLIGWICMLLSVLKTPVMK